jgi:hypothetical protein
VQSRARYGVMTAFNTVVLFDVENLLGAPAGWKKAAATLSFGDILTRLRRDGSGAIGGFAVSRAYANWGREFMATLRREMTENGVEPRQIYGFDHAGHKNAADIELVIDALDVAYLRGGLSTFVLVTRDGGFSALARQLHELGKTVIVCADSGCSAALLAAIIVASHGETSRVTAAHRGGIKTSGHRRSQGCWPTVRRLHQARMAGHLPHGGSRQA